ncbi:ORF6C domain-containing protein [Furfurilactobacillus entadae]|uniref:ORF6C domain-containing protein n=1 Tax=Furfurilactobacillus entadae TaxID=2922307 RepID=UPI0035EC4C78
MNELQNFNFEGSNIRTVIEDGEPMFVGKDVATVLGYSETYAMTRRLDDEDFMSTKLTGMNMKSTLINESGLYTAIMGSQLPTAKKFKHWVTSEVLPSIRKTGQYRQRPLSATEQAHLALQATAEIDDRLTTLEDTMRVSGPQEMQLKDAVTKRVLTALGGKDSAAYVTIGRRGFQQCWHDFKKHFQLPRYSELPRIQFSEAMNFIEMWAPDTEMRLAIQKANAQGELF